MKDRRTNLRAHIPLLLFFGAMLMSSLDALAVGDDAQLISVSIPAGTPIMPRTKFIQTWTFQNIGTNTWSPGQSGCTLNMLTNDSIGALALFTNAVATAYHPVCIINGGKSIAPGAQGSFSMSFVVPETPGPVTNYFQLNGAAGDYFGPQVTVSIVVSNAGSTNQYDRARAIAYANNYAGYVVNDGYFWTNGSDYAYFGPGAKVPTAYLGDDCAHFVSSCVGRQPGHWGGGLFIRTRVSPTYGEPGASELVNTCLIAPGYAKEVFSLSEMAPGDVIGWNWEGDSNIGNLDHVTLYLGNGLVASHARSALGVSATTFFQSSSPNWRWHLVHILDAPTLASTHTGTNLVLSWGTNWAGYSLYSATAAGSGATWTKVAKAPVVIGSANVLTNAISGGAKFYRLELP